MATIKIPSQLRPQTEGADQVEIMGNTVGEALTMLAEKYPALKDRIYDEKGTLRRYVNIYLGDEDIRFLDNLETRLESSSELSLVPAIAGGII
ncbi:MAG: MoaD/ThiS family protein [Spirochaetia bacterium]|nr:MoaD/ThiS family protein [Spirochaetia bacterium]